MPPQKRWSETPRTFPSSCSTSTSSESGKLASDMLVCVCRSTSCISSSVRFSPPCEPAGMPCIKSLPFSAGMQFQATSIYHERAPSTSAPAACGSFVFVISNCLRALAARAAGRFVRYQFRRYAHGDLLRRLRANVKADRRMDARNLLLGKPAREKLVAHSLGVGVAADRANVPRARF